MKKSRIILLPGLHGTDGLFRTFAELCPKELTPCLIGFPTQQTRNYEDLIEIVRQQVDSEDTPYLILGESFSGPLALFFASTNPRGLLGVILVASFILPPIPKITRLLPWRTAYKFGGLFYKLLAFVTPFPRKAKLFREMSEEVQKVNPSVLLDRLKNILNVDASESLRKCSSPILYIQGSRDPFVRNNSLRRIRSIRDDITVCRVSAPHMVLQNAPNEAWKCIIEFLNTKCAA